MIKTINAEYVFSTESKRHTTEKDTFRNAILKVPIRLAKSRILADEIAVA